MEIIIRSIGQIPVNLDGCAGWYLTDWDLQILDTQRVEAQIAVEGDVALGILVDDLLHASQAFSTKGCILFGFGKGIGHCCFSGQSIDKGSVGSGEGESADGNVVDIRKSGNDDTQQLLVLHQVSNSDWQTLPGLLSNKYSNTLFSVVVLRTEVDSRSGVISLRKSLICKHSWNLADDAVDIW